MSQVSPPPAFSRFGFARPFLSRPGIRWALVIGTVCAVVFNLWPRTPTPVFFFEATIRSSTPAFAQLYYDTGPALNEANSARLRIEGGNKDAVYRFPLPEGRFTNLRFDPTDHGGTTMVLSHIRIVHRGGGVVRAIQPNQLRLSHGMEQLDFTDTEVKLTSAATGATSFLTVDLGEPLLLKSTAQKSWRTTVRRFFPPFLLAFVVGLLVAPAFRRWRLKESAHRWGAEIRSWSHLHPQQAVLVVAALFVIASCYPVVFFGKSFVSPNNHSHTFLLYGEMPTLPGYKAIATDDEKGSDLGAAMWQNFPYSVVEARALSKYHELPLWNRYNATGLPLLGQGLSMCADPLQLVVLATGGSSVGWDLKYLLAKFLFAACIGLCVLQAARHLPAAMILAATAPFIGFFSYRYTHPAFFTLCYAPAVLLCWFKLIDSRPGRATALWLGGMVLADWTLLNGGGLKESYILFLTLNFCGLLTLLLGHSVVGGKGWKLLQVSLVKVLFVAIAMPVWLTFFHALGNSVTVYDAGGAFQLAPSLLIGLFDDIFYRQFNLSEDHLDPSLNFLVLLAVLWFLFSPRRADPRGLSRSLTITTLIALAFVFALVPARWIIRVPFLKNIGHIDNTFSCVAIICLLVLAGFGIKTFWNNAGSADFKRVYLRVIALLAALVALYLGSTEAAMRSTTPLLHMTDRIPKSDFFWGYSLSLLLAVALLPWLGRLAFWTRSGRIFQVASLTTLFILLHWRQGMHLSIPFDAYVMNPQERVNLVADSSAALQLVKGRTPEPSRSVGLDWAFFPGYGGAVGVEQIDGPDPILNKHYRSLMDTSGVKLLFGSWRVGVAEEQLNLEPVLFNMLNVRYYLGYVPPSVEFVSSLKKIASLDMDVYESEHVWPRAFFTDGLVSYEHEGEFIELLQKGDGKPFAAVPLEELGRQKDLTEFASHAAPAASRQVMPAHDYAFTNNTTSFKVTAPGPGVVVLTESFVPGDFQAQLNGQPADYFRINSAFKGLFIPKAGDYTISYAYWPRYFTLSLLIAAAGATILLCWLSIMTKGSVSRRAVS